jgi:hypothetical protein
MLRFVPWVRINRQDLDSVSSYKNPLLEQRLTARISFPRAASALSLFDFLMNPMMIVENTAI